MNAGLTRNIDNSFSARPALVEFVVAPFRLPQPKAQLQIANKTRRSRRRADRGYDFLLFLMGEAG
jgi:hypothetical protein